MQNDKQVCAITGADGYVGSRIAANFARQGWIVKQFVYNPSATLAANPDVVSFTLGGALAPEAFAGVDALVHCAYDFTATAWDAIQRINVEGSRALFAAAAAAGVSRIVHISTMSAYPGCVSLYGKAKLLTERLAFDAGGRVCRPGLVYGRQPGGMVGALNRLVARTSIVPLPGGGRQTLYLANEADLSACILRLASRDSSGAAQAVIGASEQGLTFRNILEKLAAARGKRLRFIGFPWRLAWLGLKAAEGCHVNLGFRSDSLVSLMNQDTAPDFSATRALGAQFRPFDPKDMQ